MRRLRWGLIGSIRAWLPSRRSTAHHMGAVSMTLSGQVRSGSEIFSTSSAKLRYRLTGIDEPRWVFQAGWPGCGAPDGGVMVRPVEKASEEISGVFISSWLRELDGTRPAHRETPATGSRSDQTPPRRPRRSTRCTPNTIARPTGSSQTAVVSQTRELGQRQVRDPEINHQTGAVDHGRDHRRRHHGRVDPQFPEHQRQHRRHQ